MPRPTFGYRTAAPPGGQVGCLTETLIGGDRARIRAREAMAVTAVGADHAGQGRPAEMPAGAATGAPTRRGRLRVAAAARGVPLATVLTAVAVVALVYLAGKLIYRLRDVVLMMMVAGFIALILNPLLL